MPNFRLSLAWWGVIFTDEYLTLSSCLDVSDSLEEGGLAAAGRSKKRNKFAFVDFQVYVFEGLYVPVPILVLVSDVQAFDGRFLSVCGLLAGRAVSVHDPFLSTKEPGKG
jgi:hypothetical protein